MIMPIDKSIDRVNVTINRSDWWRAKRCASLRKENLLVFIGKAINERCDRLESKNASTPS